MVLAEKLQSQRLNAVGSVVYAVFQGDVYKRLF